MSETVASFPRKLRFLFDDSRYKIARGGRGSGKSWGVARALLIRGAAKTTRVLCAREVQKSIQQSVHQLLKDQIAELGLGHLYEVLATEIRGQNGTQFFFAGLSDQTAESLKSFEGVDICWVEEAQSVSKSSWEILIPTIRKTGSEIWVTYNPQLESDETHVRFTVNPPPDCVNVEMNYIDNPYFPPVLDAERKHAKATLAPEVYAHIWEGKCKPAVEGAIYFAQMGKAHIGEVPHDERLKTHAIWDMGYNDSMSIILAQRVASEIRIIRYIEGQQRTLADYSAELKALKIDGRPINWGGFYLPHDAFAKRHQTGRSDANVLSGMGWDVRRVPSNDVEAGINRAREMFPRVWFSQTGAARLIECLKRYRRHVSATHGEPGKPVHDEFSHGCLVGDSLIDTARGKVPIRDVVAGDHVKTPVGYALVQWSGQTKTASDLIEIELDDGRILVATPDHKIFTTNGVLRADALSYDCAVINEQSAPCLSSQIIELMGYRDAVIESFEAAGIGFGPSARCTSAKKAASNRCSTWTFSRPFTALRSYAQGLARQMATIATPALATGFNSVARGQGGMMLSRLTASASISSPMATTSAATECIFTGTYTSGTMGSFRRDSTFTTKTATKKTMPSRIWRFFRRLTTPGTTGQAIRGLVASKTDDRLHRLESLQNSGTQAQRAENGILQPQLQDGQSVNGIRSPASSAASNSPRHTQRGQSSATKIAKLRRFVPDAKTPVYDLTVEHHHCYFANGMLVSNSDAFRYLALVADELSNDGNSEWDKPLKIDVGFVV